MYRVTAVNSESYMTCSKHDKLAAQLAEHRQTALLKGFEPSLLGPDSQ